mmetsp:Transcript_118161/g.271131  ORF Transcript_118161/g.271131 Transcript_118161/m.271131 type:complete len:118 (+) Transcript_118161:487-840(+)
MNVSTRIQRGIIQIESDVVIVPEGGTVCATAEKLFNNLGVFPVVVRLECVAGVEEGRIVDGRVYRDVKTVDLRSKMRGAARMVAHVGAGLGVPTTSGAVAVIDEALESIAALSLAVG